MKTVYFVRHAQPNYENHNDRERELTSKGLADRQLVTEFLKDKEIWGVFSSPYRRAVDTVAPFAEGVGCQIRTVDDLRERKVGEGWIPDFYRYSLRQWEDFSYALPSGESLQQVQDRNVRALEEILCAVPEGKRVAVGSHGTALSTVIHRYQPSFGGEDFYRLGKLPWIVEFVFEGEACRRIVSYDLFSGSLEQLL